MVGIGTTSPDSILDVVGADPILTVRDTSTSGADSHATLRLAESGASDSLNLHYDISLDEGNLTFNYDNTGSNPAERMRIDSSGRVGIGTSSPVSALDVRGDISVGGGDASATQLGVLRSWSNTSDADIYALMPSNSTASGTIIEGRPNAHVVIGLKDNDSHDSFNVIGTGATYSDTGSEADNAYDTNLFCVRSSGNVGIGTTSPAYKLHVAGDGKFNGGTSTVVEIKCDDGGTATLIAMGDNQGNGRVYVGQSNTYGGGIEYCGNDDPVLSGAGSDKIALYRRDNGTSHWTARNHYNSNNWEFRGKVTAHELAGTLAQSIFDQIYPVGAVYISTSDTSPETLFGGNWTAIGGGRVLQTVSGSSPAAGSNYSSNTRSIAEANLPAHDHDIKAIKHPSNTFYQGAAGRIDVLRSNLSSAGVSGSSLTTESTEDAGSGTAFDVQQASYGVYMWKRDS